MREPFHQTSSQLNPAQCTYHKLRRNLRFIQFGEQLKQKSSPTRFVLQNAAQTNQFQC